MISLLQVLRYSAPAAFGAVGESVVQRSGTINVGLEGLMLNAAFAATEVGTATGNAWLGLLAGMAVGVATALVLGVLTIKFSLDQIVVGTAINLLSLGICGTLHEKKAATGKLPSLPSIPPLIGKFDAVLLVLILGALGVGYLLYRTSYGLKLRAAGEYPPSVEAVGFSAAKLRYQALVIGSLFGGLGGAYLALGVAQSYGTEMIAGRGFIAIALVTFARWRPVGVLLSALILGAFEAFQFEIQISGSQVSKSLLLALPYVATLLILVFVGKGTRAPQSLGVALKGSDQ